jgi:hypothetical protein
LLKSAPRENIIKNSSRSLTFSISCLDTSRAEKAFLFFES